MGDALLFFGETPSSGLAVMAFCSSPSLFSGTADTPIQGEKMDECKVGNKNELNITV